MNYLTLLLLSLQFSECAIISRNGYDRQIFELDTTATLKWNLNGVIDKTLATTFNVHYNHDIDKFMEGSSNRNILSNRPLTVEDNDPFNGRVSGTITLNNGNGVLSVELKSVEYEDSGNFTFKFLSTINGNPPSVIQEKVDITLDVQGGPSKCGDQDLPKNFTCSKGDEIIGSVTLCGKPRPNLSWMIGDQSINGTIDSTKADQHQYTYSFKHNVTSEMCGESVSYRAKGFQNNEVSGIALIQMDKYDISNVIFIQDDPCPIFTWDADDHGLCEVDLFLSFPQNDNTTKNAKVPVAQKSFQNCYYTTNATSVSYKTIVYLLIDGKRIQTSSSNKALANVGLMTTTTTTTTTTATPPTTSTTITGLSTTAKPTTRPNEMQTSEKDWSTLSFIGGYFGGIGTVILIGFIIFVVYRYSKQRNKDVNQDLSLTTVNANQNAADITENEVAAPGGFQTNGNDTRTRAPSNYEDLQTFSDDNETYMPLQKTLEKSHYEV